MFGIYASKTKPSFVATWQLYYAATGLFSPTAYIGFQLKIIITRIDLKTKNH
jgi:hypothetical protein